MKLTEKILGLLALIGIILIIATIPGGNTLTILGLGILSMIYCYFGFAFFNGIRARDIFKKSSYAGIKAIRIVGAIAAGMLLSTVVIGIMFKIMMWAGASAMLLIGFLPILIISIISVIKYSGNKDLYYKRILVRAIIFGGVALFLFLLPSDTILKIRYRCCPDYVNAVIAASNDPDNEALQQKAQEEEDKMNKMAGIE
jgi:hypothetical protein